MTTPLSPFEITAFVALSVALVCLWVPAFVRGLHAQHLWAVPFACSLVAACAGGVIDRIGLLAILTFGLLCTAARRVPGRRVRGAVHVAIGAMAAALYLHLVPGFHNPRVITDAVLTPDAAPFTKYMNFDKGSAALILLGLYAPECTATDKVTHHAAAFLWRFPVIVALVMLLSLSLGYVRWEVKVAPWWPIWSWAMIFLTALPEEAVFRGIVQRSLERWAAGAPHATTHAVATAGMLFGIAHSGGGLIYVALASVAGIGYGWVFASTRSLAAAILTHTGLNAVHFVFFTYPALRDGGAL
jgi:membrane protease YdiL (CAAX protease family)